MTASTMLARVTICGPMPAGSLCQQLVSYGLLDTLGPKLSAG